MISLPDTFNAAAHFVDRHIGEGRGPRVAIECGDERVTYGQLAERVNRFASALRGRLQVQPEQRVALMLQDGPAFAYSFFGAIKAGVVPVPLNTMWRAKDYQFALNDSAARAVIISEPLLREFSAVDRGKLPHLQHVIVAGDASAGSIRFDELLDGGSTEFDPVPTHRDAMAFWLYSSGSTGSPKGCVHLQHDMLVCAESYAKARAGDARIGSLLQRGQVVLRLRPGQRPLHAARGGRHVDSAAGRANGAARLRDHRALSSDAVVLQRAHEFRHVAVASSRRRRL